MSDEAPALELNDGRRIPRLGFGVFMVDQGDTRATVTTALAAGYRHVDTAAAYGNESQVGDAIRACDEHVYVTTKYFNPSDSHGRADATTAFDASLARLGLDNIDPYLIHWPVRAGEGFVESWRALTELREGAGRRSIGVSNFSSTQLDQVIDASGVTPAVNQVELHPYFQQAELRRVHAERGPATEAWGPLGQGTRHAARVLDDPVLVKIGRARGNSVGQVVIRWHLQIGTIVIQVHQPGANPPEPRRLWFRAHRRGHGRHHHARPRRTERTRPRHLRIPSALPRPSARTRLMASG